MTGRKPFSILSRLLKSWASSFEEKRHLLLSVFYSILFLQMTMDLLRLWDPLLGSYRHIQWPVAAVKMLGLSLPSAGIYFLTVGSLFLAVLFPFVFLIRLIAGLAFFLSSAYLSSVEADGHSKVIYVLTALTFAGPWLLSKKESLFKWIAVLQIYVISTYVSAGLWKLRFFVSEGLESGRWSELAVHHWKENIAQVLATGSLSESIVFHSQILSSDALSLFLFVAAVISQLGIVILAFFPRFLVFGMIPILVFHFVAMMTVGVSYRLHVWFCILLFFVSFLAQSEKKAFLTRRLAVTLMAAFLVTAQIVLPRLSATGEIYPLFSWNLFGGFVQTKHYDLILEFSEPGKKACFFSSCGILPDPAFREPIWSLIQEAGHSQNREEREKKWEQLRPLLVPRYSLKSLHLVRLKGPLSETFVKTPNDTDIFESLQRVDLN